MPSILLVRHGETDWNRSGQIMGARPIPLNQQGEAQVERLAHFLRRWARPDMKDPQRANLLPGIPSLTPGSCCLVSTVTRALQTARALGEALDLPVHTDGGLTEIGVGAWEGRYWRDLDDDPNRLRYYSHPTETRPPGGETFREVQVRAVAAVHRMLDGPATRTFILVSHADVIRSIVAYGLSLEPQQTRAMRIDHTSLTGMALQPSLPSLLFLNYIPAILAQPTTG